jgi:predicted RNA binding protein YcfA (HicA-like mRNA interferase family)
MKLPRDVTGSELASRLGKFGYEITRQNGSHIRLTTQKNGEEHHITIPRHDPLKVGTFFAILNDVAKHLEISRDELIEDLF